MRTLSSNAILLRIRIEDIIILDSLVKILGSQRAPWPSDQGVIFRLREPMAPGSLLGKSLIRADYLSSIFNVSAQKDFSQTLLS